MIQFQWAGNLNLKGRYYQINQSEQTCTFYRQSEAKTEGGGVFPPFEAVFITRFDWVNCCLCYDWSDVTSSLLVSR